MTGATFRKIRESLGLSREELGERMKLSRATLQRREVAEEIPPAEAAYILLLARARGEETWQEWRDEEMRRQRSQGETLQSIGEAFGVSAERVRQICDDEETKE